MSPSGRRGGHDPAEVRKRIQALRKGQDPSIAARSAKAVGDALLSSLPLRKGMKVAIYRSLPEELDLEPLARHFEAQGVRTFYPRVVDAQARKMGFVEALLGAGWSKGAYGIEEPDSSLPAVAASEMDVIVVPGVAFSPSGERIGRGAGYYDRALKGAEKALKVALAFDFQVLDSLPQHADDQKVDWVLTERQDLRTSRVAAWLALRKHSV